MDALARVGVEGEHARTELLFGRLVTVQVDVGLVRPTIGDDRRLALGRVTVASRVLPHHRLTIRLALNM